MTRDDDAWLAALAGRSDASETDDRDARDDAVHEARMLREALLRWSPTVEPLPQDEAAYRMRLLARARAAGLFGDPEPTAEAPTFVERLHAWLARPRSSRAPARWAAAFVALAVVALVVVYAPVDRRGVDEGVVRGGGEGVTTLRASDPEALRREIVAALGREGVRASTYTRFGRLGIDADLPMDRSVGLSAVLAHYGVAPPVDGALRLEIEATGP